MSARDRILARLAAHEPAHTAPFPNHLRPALPGDTVDIFLARLEEAAATTETLHSLTEVPERVLAYRRLRELSGPTAIAPALAGLSWPDELDAEIGTSDGGHLLAVSRAIAGIAETGTLALASGPNTPTRLNFLPDFEVVVLERGHVVAHYEDVWTGLAGRMPRVVNFVTGPSRTADVEQTIQLGAHGPRSLHLLLID